MPQESVQKNSHYPSYTVGSELENNVPTIHQSYTLEQARSIIQKNIKNYETINYIYVINHYNELIGVIPIKELFGISNKDLKIETLIKEKPVFVHPYTTRERAAYLALKHNIETVPIVDKNSKFLGVIDGNKILSIMYEELTEDFFKRSGHFGKSGTSELENIEQAPINKLLKHRLPWIIFGTLGSLLIATIIHNFEATISSNLILASFIPLMVYISNAVSQQMNAFIIRDLAIRSGFNGIKYIVKSLIVVFFIAVVIGTIVFLYSTLTKNTFQITNVLATAVFFSIMSSVTTGLFVPIIFSRLKFDPADTSGPIGTVVQDFISIIIYFLVASKML